MSGQLNTREAETAKIFDDNQSQTFPVLAKALRERLAVSARDLSIRLNRHRAFITKVEAGKFLLCEKDVKSLAETLGLNDGFAGQFTQKWLTNYEAGIKKVFADHPDDPFPVLFRAIRETIGIAADKLSELLGKYASHIPQVEQKNAFFSEAQVLESVKIFRLQADLAEDLKARWKKHYQDRKGRKKDTANNPKAEVKVISEEELEDFFLDKQNEPFPVFFSMLRRLLKITLPTMAKLLNQTGGFIRRFEKLSVFMPEPLALASVKIFGLSESFTNEFLDKWEGHAAEYRDPKTIRLKDDDGLAKTTEASPKKTDSEQEVMDSPLGRLAEYLCRKAGIDLGLSYLQRNGGEIKIANLGPNTDNSARLMEVCALARRLKLGPNQIHELATVLFANHPGKYRLTFEGGGLDFLDSIINFSMKWINASISEV